MPAHLKPGGAQAPAEPKQAEIDGSWMALVRHWPLVVADLSAVHGIDLYDPAVRARPWPGVRTLIFDLLDRPTRLREVLTMRR